MNTINPTPDHRSSWEQKDFKKDLKNDSDNELKRKLLSPKLTDAERKDVLNEMMCRKKEELKGEGSCGDKDRLSKLQDKFNKKTLSDDEKEELANMLGIHPDELDQPNDGDAPERGKANKDFKEDVKGSTDEQLKDMMDDEDLSQKQKDAVLYEMYSRKRGDLCPEDKKALDKLMTAFMTGTLDDEDRKKLAQYLGVKPGDLKRDD